jgi:hypothetical protein
VVVFSIGILSSWLTSIAPLLVLSLVIVSNQLLISFLFQDELRVAIASQALESLALFARSGDPEVQVSTAFALANLCENGISLCLCLSLSLFCASRFLLRC